jgi:hypothetical protein
MFTCGLLFCMSLVTSARSGERFVASMSFCAAAYIDTTSEPCIVNWYWLFDWRPPI